MHACMHTYIHTYIHAYIYASIHTYIHTYICLIRLSNWYHFVGELYLGILSSRWLVLADKPLHDI